MNPYTDDFYFAAIKNADPNAYRIRAPEIRGKNAVVFLADVGKQTYVYRFTNEFFIWRNHQISQLLAQCNIPAPCTSVHCYDNVWFEKYKYYPGLTLKERIDKGMTEDDVMAVYKDALRIQYQISKIDTYELRNVPYTYYSAIYSKRTHNELPPIVSDISSAIIFTMSHIGKMHLFHNDLNPGNIIVGPDNRVSCVLDIDGINISNTCFAFIRLIQSCPIDRYLELLDYYEDTAKQKLPRRLLMTMLKFQHMTTDARQRFEHIFNISR